jgi:hypothetical protein
MPTGWLGFGQKKEILSLMCLKRLNFDADGVTRFWPKKEILSLMCVNNELSFNSQCTLFHIHGPIQQNSLIPALTASDALKTKKLKLWIIFS